MELKTASGRLFVLLMVIIAFPLLQQNLSFFESGKLNGAIKPTPNPVFSWDNWWDGTYQKQKEGFINDSIGCRPDLVRLNNQIDFALFNKMHANGVVMGKDGYLFEQGYIEEYDGRFFLGDDAIRELAIKIKKIQDTLTRLGKTFVFMYAPSKAWYFPDKFPSFLDYSGPRKPTNYMAFKRLCDSIHINQIDFNGWFLTLKNTSKDPLFTKTGTHWSQYGSLVAEDSFIKYIENARQITLPHLKWNTIRRTDTPNGADNDLASGINLIWGLQKEQYSYPNWYYENDGARTKPSAVYIGDSFFWVWMDNNMVNSINTDWSFWYYFYEAWNKSSTSGQEPPRHPNEFDWQKELVKTDCVVTLYNPSIFKTFIEEFSFFEKTYQYFYPEKK